MESNSRLAPFWKLVVSVIGCELVGAMSGFLASAQENNWFDALQKPNWNPPSYLFGPVWICLYALMGISFSLIWKNNSTLLLKRNAYTWFGIQLFFNFCWSLLFFRYQNPAFALIDILLLDITLTITMVQFYRFSKTASLLLGPYLAWVLFASVLNYSIWRLNS